MTVIACVGERFGLSFNGRRLSRDRVVSERILLEAAGGRLLCRPRSAGLFASASEAEQRSPIVTTDSLSSEAGPEDCCFIEFAEDLPALAQADRVVLFQWNRAYPYDQVFPIEGWTRTATEDFPGNSHEQITKEIYHRPCET